MPTIQDSNSLSRAQENAIGALIRSATGSAAAEEAHVARQTLSMWTDTNSAFFAALDRERRNVWEQEQVRVQNIRTRALDVIVGALQKDQCFDQAIEVLKVLSRLNAEPGGPTTPERVTEEQAVECLTTLN